MRDSSIQQPSTVSNPLVSVVVPTYNCGHYISQAVDSVLDQTFQDFELIVVDDGSTDGTESEVRRYGDRVRYLRQENRGPSAAKNLGIKNSRGSLIATLDADDLWKPEKLETQFEYMKCHPKVGLVYSNCATFNEKGIVSESIFGRYHKAYQGNIFDTLILKNFIGSITVMVRKECLDNVGLFPENFLISEDWHLWLRIAKNYPIGYIEQPLALYRWQTQSLTWEYDKAYPYRLNVLKEIISLYPDYFSRRKLLVRKAYGGLFMRYGYALYKSESYQLARRKLLSSIFCNPYQLKALIYLGCLLLPKRLQKFITSGKRMLGIQLMPPE